MKKTLILLSISLFCSCSFLFPKHFERKPANFTVQNLWFTSKLDKNRNVKYLINPTQLHYMAKSTDDYNEQLIAFFKEELKENIYFKENYKDANGKVIIPFILDYDLSKEYKENLQKTTDLDYIVLTKILTASQINNQYYKQYKSLQYRSNVLAGSVVFFKIVDVKNNTIALELNCKSSVYDDPNFNFDTNQYEDNLRLATYKSENQLIKKCFKRIFRRIN